MPRDATATRDRLRLAALRRFAEDGIHGARTRDIVRDAGQGNASAIGYHFGDRRGLLVACVAPQVEQMETERREGATALAATRGVAPVVRALVEPTAGRLATQEGRWFLRLIAQLTDEAGVREHAVPRELAGPEVVAQLAMLEERVAERTGRSIAAERIGTAVAFLTAALAERARRVDGGQEAVLSPDAWTAELVAMLTGALLAPVPRAAISAVARTRVDRARS